MATKRLRAVIWSAVSSKVQAADDKVSLDEQYRVASAFADGEGMDIIDHLQIPGHSRAETDVLTLFDAYAEIGVLAYHKLRAHWQANDFDVLIAFHPNRLGRSFSAMAMCLENIVKQGRRAYFIQGGWANAENVDYFLAMAGVAAKSETKQRVSMGKKGTLARLKAGLPARGPRVTHTVERDHRGRPVRLVVNEANRPLFDLLKDLILQGFGYAEIADRINALGYRGQRGGKWSASQVFRTMMHPTTWGHVIYSNPGNLYGVWGFDASHPVPEGIEIERNPPNAVPPVWTGTDAEAIKAELLRRHYTEMGKTADDAYHLTGLLKCGTCGRRMVVAWAGSGQGRYWACAQRKAAQSCPNRKYLSDKTAKRQIEAFLRRALAMKWDDLAMVVANSDVQRAAEADAERLRLAAEIKGIEGQIEALIVEQSLAPASVRPRYRANIEALSERLTAFQQQLERVPRIDVRETQARRRAGLAQVMAGIDNLWSSSPLEFNRAMLAALGRLRFTVEDGKINGIG